MALVLFECLLLSGDSVLVFLYMCICVCVPSLQCLNSCGFVMFVCRLWFWREMTAPVVQTICCLRCGTVVKLRLCREFYWYVLWCRRVRAHFGCTLFSSW